MSPTQPWWRPALCRPQELVHLDLLGEKKTEKGVVTVAHNGRIRCINLFCVFFVENIKRRTAMFKKSASLISYRPSLLVAALQKSCLLSWKTKGCAKKHNLIGKWEFAKFSRVKPIRFKWNSCHNVYAVGLYRKIALLGDRLICASPVIWLASKSLRVKW